MNEEIKVSIFANLQSYTSKEIGMDEVIRLIKHDTIVMQKTAVYRQMAHVLSREEANKNVKVKSMEACSVAVVFDGNGKQPENVVRFTGLAMVDLDKLGDKLPTVYQKVIADPHTEDCYTTISGEGLRIFYRYTRQDTDSPLNAISWKAAFVTGNEYYKKLTGCDYDTGCSNYGRLSGLAHDPEVYYNPDAEPFVITDEMIVKANFADNTHEGRPYKEHTAGTQQSTPEEAWQRVQHLLSKRNMTYEPHHRHDYILHACYLFNRFGVPDDDLRTWSENQWNDFDNHERNSIITHCYKQEDEHGTWCLHSDRRNKRRHENAMITIAEIRQWLSEHTEVIYNVVTDQTMIRHTLINSQLSTNHYQLLDDRILATLRAQMSIDTDKRVLKSDVYDVIKSDFARLVHPVRDYLNSLPLWDGNDRIAELASHLHAEAVVPEQSDEEAQQALCWALHKWHCAAVGTWLDDSVTNHEVFVLIGKQGIYKTTCFRFLLPPELRSYFWENAHNAFSSKDDHLALSENCLTVIEEVEATGSHELSELKSLITSDTIKERRPYARFREAKHRLASFCATGNQQHFLTDDTGNRRWLCFKVSHIDDPRTWKINYQQLYAQLLHEFQHGFRYWFDSADEQQVERLNQPFRVESDEEQLIQTRLRVPQEGEPTKLMNAATICQLLNGGRVGYPLSSRKISIAMIKLGFHVEHTRRGNMFRVYEIPYDRIQPSLAIDAYEAKHHTENGQEPGFRF
ncbi:MAG: hypothetical protein IJ534_01160 [Bacteroidaceae bacterium]|nr:hypothetical protein [Bacteroidaceae bacterium]